MFTLLTITGLVSLFPLPCSNAALAAANPNRATVALTHRTDIIPSSPPVSMPYMPPNPSRPPGRDEALGLGLRYVLAERTTNYFHASPTQAKNIELVAKRLNGLILEPGQTFSYNHELGPYTAGNGYGWGRAFLGDRIVPSMGGGVCQGASTLYSALLRTGLPIVERHQHGLTVPYLPAGEDATVSEPTLDFRFQNNLPTPVMIGASADSQERFLTVALWGAKPLRPLMVHHRVISTSAYSTLHKRTDKLPKGQHHVMFPGQNGVQVETWVDNPADQVHSKRSFGVDTYLASPRVIEDGQG
ncbi:VanW family protein [Alicyclobacillus fastidiosus]|uniref:VanW family protein n=1 Tax=Alicyclobacillus fastidiosus TaxID=392011 RepID=A0ABV5AI78_9BACL|nr:VanW family protein [Alicyclobacillus fastidiosus]WEH10161.1 VanW family protein [Alicyclobacillus fastidiosus]